MIEFKVFGIGPRKLIGIHGWFGDESTFSPLEHTLSPNEFQCAWLAHRGYGKSKGVAGRYTMEEMAQDAITIADQLDWESFAVIGHSMGGKAAQLVAARAPERVTKLICVTPVSAAPIPFDEQTRQLFAGAATDRGCRTAVVNHSVGGRLSSSWVDRLVATSSERSDANAFAAYFRSWADDDLSAEVGRRDQETLVLAGAEDPTITTDFCDAGFRDHFPRLTVEGIANSGHYPMDETPLIFGARIAKFLKD